jgi:hypothetical protein
MMSSSDFPSSSYRSNAYHLSESGTPHRSGGPVSSSISISGASISSPIGAVTGANTSAAVANAAAAAAAAVTAPYNNYYEPMNQGMAPPASSDYYNYRYMQSLLPPTHHSAGTSSAANLPIQSPIMPQHALSSNSSNSYARKLNNLINLLKIKIRIII